MTGWVFVAVFFASIFLVAVVKQALGDGRHDDQVHGRLEEQQP